MQGRHSVPQRIRLDAELVRQGFFPTTEDALRSILAGEVSGANRRMTSAGEQVMQGVELHVRGRQRYASRGGLKLEHGLAALGVEASGLDCVDVGCSTGGFTDCLLKHGARSVLAVDVGRAQFDWSLRQDDRVRLLERTNILDVPDLPGEEGRYQLAVCDVSFTSVVTIAPAVVRLLAPQGTFLTLVKPQFEAPREDVGVGGVVRSDEVRRAALARVSDALVAAGFAIDGSCESPITGHKGNVEYLLAAHLR
jgi:23S rRNA (cytidine1920-2'-O)/16S rRNA (cytidine1409-2'-O)-methyltransferase